MEMKKTEVKINKPRYLGQAVLDLSKTLMFEFWYNYLKRMYGDKIRLCYADTYSFIMHIKTDDFTKILVLMQINGLIPLILIKIIIDLQKLVKSKRYLVNLKMSLVVK